MQIRYRVNGPNIVADVIDGEAVIVNLEKGTYYSLHPPGAEIWEAILTGATVGEIQQMLSGRYVGDAADIAGAVGKLVTDMELEGLLITDDQPAPAGTAPSNGPAAVPGDRPPFQHPVLHKYSDMEAILMLDPIHEVDETGWPAAKPQE